MLILAHDQRLLRLLAARRPAVGLGPAHRVRRRAVDPGRSARGSPRSFFGGEFPGADLLERFYVLHILIVPAAIGRAHRRAPGHPRAPQAHPLPGAGPARRQRRRRAAVADLHGQGAGAALPHRAPSCSCSAAWPRSTRSGSTARSAPADVSAASQPDWYMGWLDGALRIMPPWEIRVVRLRDPEPVLPRRAAARRSSSRVLYLAPFIEAQFTKDRGEHHVLDRPRDRPCAPRSGWRRWRSTSCCSARPPAT